MTNVTFAHRLRESIRWNYYDGTFGNMIRKLSLSMARAESSRCLSWLTSHPVVTSPDAGSGESRTCLAWLISGPVVASPDTGSGESEY